MAIDTNCHQNDIFRKLE
jgi:hypothetical protein